MYVCMFVCGRHVRLDNSYVNVRNGGGLMRERGGGDEVPSCRMGASSAAPKLKMRVFRAVRLAASVCVGAMFIWTSIRQCSETAWPMRHLPLQFHGRVFCCS
mmetsp:Transcript_8382/g.14387  ORF Transcript_8382/g.14387 Transcript_8382/m.14387 type:complete len:102 (-) Transcript_8382:37-342(-)